MRPLEIFVGYLYVSSGEDMQMTAERSPILLSYFLFIIVSPCTKICLADKSNLKKTNKRKQAFTTLFSHAQLLELCRQEAPGQLYPPLLSSSIQTQQWVMQPLSLPVTHKIAGGFVPPLLRSIQAYFRTSELISSLPLHGFLLSALLMDSGSKGRKGNQFKSLNWIFIFFPSNLGYVFVGVFTT